MLVLVFGSIPEDEWPEGADSGWQKIAWSRDIIGRTTLSDVKALFFGHDAVQAVLDQFEAHERPFGVDYPYVLRTYKAMFPGRLAWTYINGHWERV